MGIPEILFRGKRIKVGGITDQKTSQWVYGYYSSIHGDPVIMAMPKDCCFSNDFFVDSETVTQYINLKDSTPWGELSKAERTQWICKDKMPEDWKGKKIFQKDIVEITSSQGKLVHCVSRLPEENYLLYGIIPLTNWKDGKRTLVLSREDVQIKVIGNYFDNQEMMGVKNGE